MSHSPLRRILFALANIGVLLMLLGASLTCAAKDNEKRKVTVRAVSHASQVNERTSTYTTPGTSNTNCTGVGTTVGSTTTATANCQTTSTPAQTNQVTSRTVDVVNVVELRSLSYTANGTQTVITQYTIRCTAHWVGSSCGPMIDGDTFPAEIDGNTMWIVGRKGGNQGKEVRVKYKILDIRPAASE